MRWLRFKQLNKRQPASLVEINFDWQHPGGGRFAGVGLLIFLVGERLVKGKESLLAQNGDISNTLEWRDGLAGIYPGLFLMGQILVPLAFSFLQFKPAGSGVQIQAFVLQVTCC